METEITNLIIEYSDTFNIPLNNAVMVVMYLIEKRD
jgi:hypothetical protein